LYSLAAITYEGYGRNFVGWGISMLKLPQKRIPREHDGPLAYAILAAKFAKDHNDPLLGAFP